MTIASKIAVAVECIIDFNEAQELMKDRWYGDTTKPDIPYQKWSRAFFSQVPPRKGMLGFIHDMKEHGSQFIFFTAITDDVQGRRTEEWMRDWLADPFMSLEQTTNTARLDAQVIFVPKGEEMYEVPADRPRVAEVPTEGPFDPDQYLWALDLAESGQPPAETAKRPVKKQPAASDT